MCISHAFIISCLLSQQGPVYCHGEKYFITSQYKRFISKSFFIVRPPYTTGFLTGAHLYWASVSTLHTLNKAVDWRMMDEKRVLSFITSPMISVTDTVTGPSNPTLCTVCVTSVSQTDNWLVLSHCDAIGTSFCKNFSHRYAGRRALLVLNVTGQASKEMSEMLVAGGRGLLLNYIFST